MGRYMNGNNFLQLRYKEKKIVKSFFYSFVEASALTPTILNLFFLPDFVGPNVLIFSVFVQKAESIYGCVLFIRKYIKIFYLP